jgi:hypothetical protein
MNYGTRYASEIQIHNKTFWNLYTGGRLFFLMGIVAVLLTPGSGIRIRDRKNSGFGTNITNHFFRELRHRF